MGQNRGILVLKELLIISLTVPTTFTLSAAYVPGPGCSLVIDASLSFIELKGATLQEESNLKLDTMFMKNVYNRDINGIDLLISGFLRVFKRIVGTWGDITWRWYDEMFSHTFSPL